MRVTRRGVRVEESCERKESGNPKRTKPDVIDDEDYGVAGGRAEEIIAIERRDQGQ